MGNTRTVGASTIVATLAIWCAHKLGWTLESYYAVFSSGIVCTVALWLSQEGLRGAWNRILNGKSKL